MQKPLPNLELLELQWYLHGTQGMGGAVVDPDWDYELSADSNLDDAQEVDSQDEDALGFNFDDDIEDLSLFPG